MRRHDLNDLVDSCLALRNVHLVADIAVVSPVVDLILILSSVQRVMGIENYHIGSFDAVDV
jgi:hypothetical protein